jgi:transglutaminase-like putative cysteine protease
MKPHESSGSNMKFALQSISSLGAVLLAFVLLANVGISSAGKSDLESLSVVEREIITETIQADGTIVEIDELTTLVKSQLIVDAESQADLPYNSTFSNLEILEAYTITPQGEKIPVAPNAIRTVEDDNSSGAAMFSDQKHKIIIFPKVTPGSRTYYKAKLTTFKPLLPGFFYTRLTLSPNVEVKHYEYHLSYPESIPLYFDIKGVKQTSDETKAGMRHVSYFYQNLKPIIKEPYQIANSDFSPYIYISSMPNQAAFARAYEERVVSKSLVTPEVQKLADEITKGIDKGIDKGGEKSSNPSRDIKKEQARAIYNWVTRNIRYVAIYLGDGGIIPHDASSIIRNRYGDCKDHNALLIALLSAKGIQATSALVNSGSAFVVPKIPVIGPFNHMITYIPAWDLYLDSTSEMAPFGVLPSMVIDKPTLLTKLEKVGRTPKAKKEDHQMVTGITMTIEKDGQIKGKAHTKYFGVADISARYKYEGVETSYADKFVKNQLAKFRQTGEGKISTSYVYDLDKPFTSDTEFTLDAIANVPGPGAISVPVGLAPGELAIIANDRPPEKFTKPYTCSTRMVGEAYQIQFPSNAKVTRIPPDVTYERAGIKYESTYTERNNSLLVTRKLAIQRAGAVCQPAELQNWRDFYQVFIKDMRGQIFYE